ncbi:MAG: hypothetical protein LYZ70_02660 [Nitrososphaerales archaeon]|nr:hypothetical protein [Nitrososphaerales archaeon]
MKPRVLVLLLLGAIIALAGLTFTLQGLGIVGPGTSFMFENPLWVTQGELTFVIGLILIIAAFALNRQPDRKTV